MNAARDRFVAFAFCWADILIELDPQQRISFAVGATKALLGLGPEGLSGAISWTSSRPRTVCWSTNYCA